MLVQINAGQPQQAEELLDKVLASSPSDLGALVARGTARALRRDLKGTDERASVTQQG
jgi:Flp pilus assembly protein TadD